MFDYIIIYTKLEVYYKLILLLLAQYTDGNRISLGGLFDKFKTDVDSYKKIIDDFKSIESFDNFIDPTGKANWDAIAKAIGNCDETALSYFKTLDDGNGTINNQSASVEGLGAHLKSTKYNKWNNIKKNIDYLLSSQYS